MNFSSPLDNSYLPTGSEELFQYQIEKDFRDQTRWLTNGIQDAFRFYEAKENFNRENLTEQASDKLHKNVLNNIINAPKFDHVPINKDRIHVFKDNFY